MRTHLPAPLPFLPLVALLLHSASASAQTSEERARFLYEAANRAIERQDWPECVDSLERAQKALGRSALRLQAPLVRCHYEQQAWADVVAAAKVYFSLDGADPSLVEYQEVGAMLVEAEKHVESARAAEAERVEADRRLRQAEEKKQRDLEAAQLAEQRRQQRAQQLAFERAERERAAHVAGAPARRAGYLAEAEEESWAAFGQRLYGVGLITVALAAGAAGLGAGIYGISVLSEVDVSDDEGLIALGALGGGIAALSFAGWLGFGVAPDEFSGADVHDIKADTLRAKAAEEDALISGSAR